MQCLTKYLVKMMTIKYTLKPSSRFKKDLKRCKKAGLNLDELKTIIHLLKCGESLPAQYHDHALKGDFTGSRECHIQPDWLLIYEVDDGELILTLVRTGSHAQLFGM